MQPDETEAMIAVKVLVVGTEAARLESLSRRLTAMGFVCRTAQTTPVALRGGLLHSPDVIAVVEVGGAWQPVRRLIENDAVERDGTSAPVLVVADGVAPSERAEAMATGAANVSDWVEIACSDRELAARLLRLARWRRQAVENAELRRRCAELETVDGLTGLPSHRGLQEYLTAEFRRAERYTAPLSLILIDVDRFRSLNETHGYPWGDRVLQAIGRGLRSIVREVDMASRYGGDEFALLLPETDAAAAQVVASRVRAMMESLGQTLPTGDGEAAAAPAPRITVSAGIGTFPQAGVATRGQILAAAESALRRAKDEGRNRIVAHTGTLAANTAPARAVEAQTGAGPDAGTGWSG